MVNPIYTLSFLLNNLNNYLQKKFLKIATDSQILLIESLLICESVAL